MSRVDEYRAHISGEWWRDIASAAKLPTMGLCAFCGAISTAVHHVRYPKKFGDDCPQNTQPVCDRCHRLAHGGVDLKALSTVKKMREPTPIGTEFAYLISEGIPWGSAESWCAAMLFPSIGHLKALLFTACEHVRRMGVDPQSEYDGKTVYRWTTVAQALRGADAAYKAHGFKKHPDTTPEQWDEWARNYDALFLWGSHLQERALAAAALAIKSGGAAANVNQAVSQALVALQDGFSEHEVRIGNIEQVVHRDLEEFITAKQGLREKSIDETVMPMAPDDRRNWPGLVGATLVAKDAAKGPQSLARLDGSAVNVTVNTWRRGDVYSAITEIRAYIASQGRLAI